MHVLLDDDHGPLTVQRLRLWHRMMARCLASRLDRELAAGASPETTRSWPHAPWSDLVGYRRDLATSLQRMLAASVSPQTRPRLLAASRSAGAARQPHVPLRQDRIAGPHPSSRAGRLPRRAARSRRRASRW